jgi:hypothetical protein
VRSCAALVPDRRGAVPPLALSTGGCGPLNGAGAVDGKVNLHWTGLAIPFWMRRGARRAIGEMPGDQGDPQWGR